MYFDDTNLFWVPPTPNTTNIDMCLLYPGTCLFVGTNISAGRGTTKPFEVIGAPFIKGKDLIKELSRQQIDGVKLVRNSREKILSRFIS
ncbi:exo-beta-N-acetylmuramidase NamZ domain-containing protein [Virgibacillus pantothenticus]|uniref:exo-beta-N-acetylmuramidase NamZ domain-containing protein n=1 Tax=Virgibacillus pantothenticus TaxID=1473 RepID=UPI0009865C3C|nr:exo-beta-N-acetylmuramidase NamZ domain-containing protein [Virgibacillus pantothenticus]